MLLHTCYVSRKSKSENVRGVSVEMTSNFKDQICRQIGIEKSLSIVNDVSRKAI